MEQTEILAHEELVVVIDNKTVAKSNCEKTFLDQIERIQKFKNHIVEKQFNPANVVIVLSNVDTSYGCSIAEVLMPGRKWPICCDKGEKIFARGFATKERMIEVVTPFDKESAEKITQVKGIPVVVVDYSVIEIFSA